MAFTQMIFSSPGVRAPHLLAKMSSFLMSMSCSMVLVNQDTIFPMRLLTPGLLYFVIPFTMSIPGYTTNSLGIRCLFSPSMKQFMNFSSILLIFVLAIVIADTFYWSYKYGKGFLVIFASLRNAGST